MLTYAGKMIQKKRTLTYNTFAALPGGCVYVCVFVCVFRMAVLLLCSAPSTLVLELEKLLGVLRPTTLPTAPGRLLFFRPTSFLLRPTSLPAGPSPLALCNITQKKLEERKDWLNQRQKDRS